MDLLRGVGATRLGLTLALLLIALGCASPAPRARTATQLETGDFSVTEVKDAEFARVLHQILTEPTLPNRLSLSGGLVRHQLGRAQRLFTEGHEEAGLAAVSGAFYLLRLGEFRPQMIAEHGTAVRLAADATARLGNEGRAQALYSMLDQVVPAGALKDDVRAHLRALSEWQATSERRGGVQGAGSRQRTRVHRAVLDPAPSAYREARETTLSWIKRAREFKTEQTQPPQTMFEREEWGEFYRSASGPLSLVALALRYGDAKDALAMLEETGAAPVAPNLREMLAFAVEENDPDAWADLFGIFAQGTSQGGEVELDPDLSRAAAWGIAVQLFRADPKSIRAAIPLASLLISFHMAEAAPLLLAECLGPEPDPRELGWAMRLTLQALAGLENLSDLSSARLVFQNAAALLELAQKGASDARTAVAAVNFMMGGMEARAGELVQARAYIKSSVEIQPTLESLRLLATILRQQQELDQTLKAIAEMLDLARKENDLAAMADAQLLLFELHRDADRKSEAELALKGALENALSARSLAGSTAEHASAERLLARALEHYGDAAGARRASDRAFESAQNDRRQLTATVLDTMRRSLILGELATARLTVRRALDADLADQDKVYAALWLKLLEGSLKAESDGTVEEALASVHEKNTWASALRDWANQKLTDAGLRALALTRIQRVEAEFYTAMALRAQGQKEQAWAALKRVAASEAIELVEVTIARDLLARETRDFRPTLPPRLNIP